MPCFRAMKNGQPLERRIPGSGMRRLPDLPRTRCRETQSIEEPIWNEGYKAEEGGPRTESDERNTEVKTRLGGNAVMTKTGTKTGGGVTECNPALAAWSSQVQTS